MKNIPVRKINQPLNDSPAVSVLFKIRDLRELLDGKDLFHGLHRHDFYFILAVQNGEGIHEIDFIQHRVYNHSVFIIRPGQVHQLQLKAGSMGFLAEFDATFYHPEDTISQQRLIKAGNKNACEFDAIRFQKLYNLLCYMYLEFTSKEVDYTDVIKANLGIFFIEFIRQSRNPNNKSTDPPYVQERLENFLGHLSNRITDLKQVSDYADLLNLSVYQLNAITKSSLGKPASQLINEQIILEAKRYLLATSGQVKDIAEHLGYEDISYFIRFFKKHTGFPPDAFRKNFK